MKGTSRGQPPDIDARAIPRWRGFNLLEKFSGDRRQRFRHEDFALMAEWGFDFARLPMSYWHWARPDRWLDIDHDVFTDVDEAIEFGRSYGIHVNLNLHRIPGYCVNRSDLEPYQLFGTDPDGRGRALDAAADHWRALARRYRGIANRHLSFDLLNEPPFMDRADLYVQVVRVLVAAIREEDPQRLIVVDGLDLGQTPIPELVDLGVVQSTRGYLPKAISHYRAQWCPKNELETFAEPRWPLVDDRGTLWDADHLRATLIEPWRPLAAAGVQIHVGEWGCYRHTPHAVALAWMRELLPLWREMGWGFALWQLRGDFGVLDSNRADVTYEPFRGHQLDRAMLDLLQSS
jgi:endoglucanase